MTDKEILEAMHSMLEPINNRLDKLEQGQAGLSDTLQAVKNSQMRVELEQFPKIAAALDGHTLNSEKLDAIQKNLEDITPTVQALEILHQTGYAK